MMEKQNERKNKKRGVTLIEMVMSIAIVGIIISYTIIRYASVKEINELKMLETRVITTINNANLSLSTNRSIQPRYMKFFEGGIVVAKGYNSNIFEIEYDAGMNRKKLVNSGFSMILNCGKENGIPCPILIYEDDDGVVSPERESDNTLHGIKSGYPLTKGIPQLTNPLLLPNANDGKGLDNNLVEKIEDKTEKKTKAEWYASNRESFRYIKLQNGNSEKTFYIAIFDRDGIVKTRIEFLKEKSTMTITPYINTGAPISLSDVKGNVEKIKSGSNWKKRGF